MEAYSVLSEYLLLSIFVKKYKFYLAISEPLRHVIMTVILNCRTGSSTTPGENKDDSSYSNSMYKLFPL